MKASKAREILRGSLQALRWTTCALPTVAGIVFEETPGLSGLDGINAAALIVLSPFVILVGFAITAAVVSLARWVARVRFQASRWRFALLVLVLTAAASPLAYLDGDWPLLVVVVLAAVPAALSLAPARDNGSRA